MSDQFDLWQTIETKAIISAIDFSDKKRDEPVADSLTVRIIFLITPNGFRPIPFKISNIFKRLRKYRSVRYFLLESKSIVSS